MGKRQNCIMMQENPFSGLTAIFYENAANGMNVRKDKNYFSCITGLTMQ
jgi:hypothetical protein